MLVCSEQLPVQHENPDPHCQASGSPSRFFPAQSAATLQVAIPPFPRLAKPCPHHRLAVTLYFPISSPAPRDPVHLGGDSAATASSDCGQQTWRCENQRGREKQVRVGEAPGKACCSFACFFPVASPLGAISGNSNVE